MGAQEFDEVVNLSKPNERIEDVFNRLRDERGYESGHLYSGTVSNKGGFVLRRRAPMTMAESDDFVEGPAVEGSYVNHAGQTIKTQYRQNGDIHQNDKWGDAFAVIICDDGDRSKIVAYRFYGSAPS